MNQKTFTTALVAAVIYGVLCSLATLYVQQGCHHCPVCPDIRDSVKQAPACTVLVDSSKIKIKDSVNIRYKDSVRYDTIPVKVEIRDTNSFADIPDTTMPDGAKIGVQIKAKLIIPPASATIWYTPRPDTTKHVIYPPVIINHRSGIGPYAGFGYAQGGRWEASVGVGVSFHVWTF